MSGPVVVGVDGSEPALDAVRWAAAEAMGLGVPLRLVHAELSSPLDWDMRSREALHRESLRWLHEAAAAARSVEPGVALASHVEIADPASLLIAQSADACVLVLGSRGMGGFGALLVGSTAVAVTGRGGCPVVVVRGEVRAGPVVVGVHGEEPAVLSEAFEQAAARRVPLIAVSASHTPSGAFTDAVAETLGLDLADHDAARGGRLVATLAPWRDKYPDVPVEFVVTHGNAADALVDHAADAGLLVVGSRGRGAFTGFLLGSTSHDVLHHAPCPVLVVRPEPVST